MISPKHHIEIKTLFSEKLKTAFSEILPFGQQKKIEKGMYVVEEGAYCSVFFLVLDGIFRTYRIAGEEEYTTGFTFKGDFDTSPFSVFFEVPATETIEALTDSTILLFKKQIVHEFLNHNAPLQNSFYLLLSGYIETLENRLHQNRSMTAEQRYLLLLESQPEEIEKIPLTFIASYLGISKERLSRIRKKNRVN